MAILIARPLAGEVPRIGSDNGLTYLPDLADDDLPAALETLRPTVLVARRMPDGAVLEIWRVLVPSEPLVVVTIGTPPAAAMPPGITGHGCASGDTATILRRVERLSARARAPRPPIRPAGTGVTLVGAGIVNLVTALQLHRAGYTVQVIDACPDPRSRVHWSRYGCTSGGENARMFTVTEADVYPPSYGAETPFGVPASAGGWRVRSSAPRLTGGEERWLTEHRTLPGWLSGVYASDLYHFSREAGRWWARLRRDLPDLFAGACVRDGIVRLYAHEEQVAADLDRHRRLRLPVTALTSTDTADRYPALADACAAGLVSGALEVPGFTVNVHDLVARLLSTLESRGVRLRWNTPVSGVRWVDGRAAGVVTPGGAVESDHYVLSPGVARGDLLRGTAADGVAHGVLGVWLTLSNVDPPLTRSLKLARNSSLAKDTNVTVAPHTIILGSGYGWTGARVDAIDPAEVRLVSGALHDTARRYFPRAYAARDPASDVIRYCIRPWTSSSLGIFELQPTARGGVLAVTGGHNTGGFAQAPAVAAAVLAALRGRRHLMHALYHPHRMRRRLRST